MFRLIPDLISSIPFDLFFLPFCGYQFTLILRLTRLLRFTKYDQYFKIWEQYSTRFPQFIRFFKLILGLILLLHYLGKE
jgi:hypothetical protein